MGLTGIQVAHQLKLTNDGGHVDVNDRYFHSIKHKYNQEFRIRKDTSSFEIKDFEVYHRILILNRYYPKNAAYIMHAFQESKNEAETMQMIHAAEMYLKKNQKYREEIKKYKQSKYTSSRKKKSIFDWMNISEWGDFKEAVAKDKRVIDSVANMTGVESRLIVSVLVGEQIRLFNSKREAFKKWIKPMKILSVESQYSFGVTGIKELTAINIEKHLKNSASKFYLGSAYEHLLDYKTEDTLKERLDRLIDYRNHFYSYMYAAIFIKQVKMQWERAGFPIDDRPEILATLFNVGYWQSVPKQKPRVGGSSIKIYDKVHSFGAISYEFYYSGELFDLFPFKPKRFDWNVD
jgi:hypothetical protein